MKECVIENSILSFEGYAINRIEFEMREIDNLQYEINTNVNATVVETETNHYITVLELSINQTEEKPLPFDLKMRLIGKFSISEEAKIDEEIKDALLQENTVAILYPFLRSAVMNVMANANISPFILPLVQIKAKYLKESDAKI